MVRQIGRWWHAEREKGPWHREAFLATPRDNSIVFLAHLHLLLPLLSHSCTLSALAKDKNVFSFKVSWLFNFAFYIPMVLQGFCGAIAQLFLLAIEPSEIYRENRRLVLENSNKCNIYTNFFKRRNINRGRKIKI